VLRIADQPLPLGVDDPVECVERYLSDQEGVLIADLSDVDNSITIPDRQPDGAKNRQGESAPQSACFASTQEFKSQGRDHSLREQERGRADVNHRIVNLDTPDLIVGEKALLDLV
jgi:hypothetical protein